jgi:hypothetical protein
VAADEEEGRLGRERGEDGGLERVPAGDAEGAEEAAGGCGGTVHGCLLSAG